MSPFDRLMATWTWPPLLLVACGLLLVVYMIIAWRRFTLRSILYVTGVAILLLTLASPIETLAREYLLSAYAMQVLCVGELVPALLWLGLPYNRPAVYRSRGDTGQVAELVIAGAIGVGVMGLWLTPTGCAAALQHPSFRMAELLSLFFAGLIYWAPLFSTHHAIRIPPVPWGVFYMFGGCAALSLVAIGLTFRGVEYTYFQNPPDSLEILPFLRDTLHLSPAEDRETAGMFLWVLGCLMYTSVIMGLFAWWYGSPEVKYEFTAQANAAPR